MKTNQSIYNLIKKDSARLITSGVVSLVLTTIYSFIIIKHIKKLENK